VSVSEAGFPVNALVQTLRNLGPLRLAALGGVGLALIGFFIYLIARFTTPEMALLYGDLEMTDSAEIVERLESMGVPYRLRRDGSEILVPADQALRLRMAMAEEGLPSGGSVGYEIFDRVDSLGTTSFVQEVNRLRALEGELARTIRSISQVKSARVHLVIPRRELFSRERSEPSASIILMMERGAALERSQVLAIQHLVAAAVPRLKPGAISIVDDHGTLLARGTEDDPTTLLAGTRATEMRVAYENRMARSIENLLQQSLGYGKVRAEVTAELDFDQITRNSETYDPDGQVVRSTQLIEEESRSTDGQGEAPVTVANNLPDAELALPGTGPQSMSETLRTEETINYEISRTVETHVRETGKVRRLSVAVLVDGTYETGPDGTVTYLPRSAEEMRQIETLVRSAMGYDAARGDTVEIVNMRFADAAPSAEDETLFLGLTRDDLMKIAELGVIGLIGVLFLLLVVRPLVLRLLEAEPEPEMEQQRLLTDESELPPALAAPDETPESVTDDEEVAREIDQMIDINQIEGRVRASSLRKISEIVEKHPEEAVNIMRGWMYQQG
jgi:flagellar M-ring protein FliF